MTTDLGRRIILSIMILLVVLSIQPVLAHPVSNNDHSSLIAQLPAQLAPQLSNPITEFAIPTSDSGPESISSGPNSTLWFTEFQAGKIGSILPNGTSIREWNVGPGARPATIIVDQKGMVWFTDENNLTGRVWRFNPSDSSFTQFSPSDPKTIPIFVLVDDSDNIWFTEINTNRIAELTAPGYTLTEYTLPSAQSGPTEMAVQPGTPNIWITEQYTGKIARFNMTDHSFQEFAPSSGLRYPVGIVVDGAGNVWVSEHGGSSIAEFQPSLSSWIEYPTSISADIQQGYSAPATLSIDELGRLWFVEHFANRVGRLTPPNFRLCTACETIVSPLQSSSLEEFTIPTPGAYSLLDAIDQNGNFWFTEFYSNKIGMILSSADSPVLIQSRVPAVPVQATAGLTTTVQITLSTNLTGINVLLGASSSFSGTGQTSQSQVSMSPSSLNLDAGPAGSSFNKVSVSITPGLTFSSGLYSVSLAATYSNFTSILIMFLQVRSFSGLLVSYLPEIVIGIIAVVAMTLFLIRRKRNPKGQPESKDGNQRTAAKAAILLTLFFLLLLAQLPYSALVLAKCPGLPPPPVGNNFGSGGDPYTFYVDVAAIALVAAVLLVVGWRILRQRSRPYPPPTGF